MNPKSNTEKINWLTFQEIETLMEEEPRQVLIDVHASWCGWCKKMDKTTFQHPDVVKYINKKFYAVKLDAEERKNIDFKGRSYKYKAAGRRGANELAIELLNGQMTLPATVFLNKKFQIGDVVPGYLDPHDMDKILHYIGDGYKKKHIPFGIFTQNYRSKIKPSKHSKTNGSRR